MDKQQKIEVLKRLIETRQTAVTQRGNDTLVAQTQQWLAEIEVENDVWINVSDALPEDKQVCIVWADVSHDKGRFHRRIAKFVAETKYCLCGWVGANEVRYWMPAPTIPITPPKK